MACVSARGADKFGSPGSFLDPDGSSSSYASTAASSPCHPYTHPGAGFPPVSVQDGRYQGAQRVCSPDSRYPSSMHYSTLPQPIYTGEPPSYPYEYGSSRASGSYGSNPSYMTHPLHSSAHQAVQLEMREADLRMREHRLAQSEADQAAINDVNLNRIEHYRNSIAAQLYLERENAKKIFCEAVQATDEHFEARRRGLEREREEMMAYARTSSQPPKSRANAPQQRRPKAEQLLHTDEWHQHGAQRQLTDRS
jgi:hypothetical protein